MADSAQQASGQPATVTAAVAAVVPNGSGRESGCLPHVLEAIYGKVENKRAALEHSLQRWWTEYANRKNDEEDEHVADSLLYDRNHLPRTAPTPDCVQRAMQQQRQQQQQGQREAQAQQSPAAQQQGPAS